MILSPLCLNLSGSVTPVFLPGHESPATGHAHNHMVALLDNIFLLRGEKSRQVTLHSELCAVRCEGSGG
jgi:hypothetical protein